MRASRTLALLLALALGLFALGGCAGEGGDDGAIEPYEDTEGTDTGDTSEDESPTIDSAPAPEGLGTIEDNTILAHSFTFAPATLEVSVGEDVIFTNGDDVTHEVEIDGENLGTMEHGESLTWTPDEAGTYDYFCPLHPEMTGTIIVE